MGRNLKLFSPLKIVKTMMGDTVNKRIVDYFATFTAPEVGVGENQSGLLQVS